MAETAETLNSSQEKRRHVLEEELRAANTQWSSSLSDVERLRIERQIQGLENKILALDIQQTEPGSLSSDVLMKRANNSHQWLKNRQPNILLIEREVVEIDNWSLFRLGHSLIIRRRYSLDF